MRTIPKYLHSTYIQMLVSEILILHLGPESGAYIRGAEGQVPEPLVFCELEMLLN
jgi:hypothetical protein